MPVKKLLLYVFAALATTAGAALACGPVPSCWMESGSAYLKSICSGYAKNHTTLKEIATHMDEPEKVPAFGNACEKLHVHLAK